MYFVCKNEQFPIADEILQLSGTIRGIKNIIKNLEFIEITKEEFYPVINNTTDNILLKLDFYDYLQIDPDSDIFVSLCKQMATKLYYNKNIQIENVPILYELLKNTPILILDNRFKELDIDLYNVVSKNPIKYYTIEHHLDDEHLFIDYVKANNLELVKYLHQNMIDIRVGKKNEAIQLAAYCGYLEIVKYLHENGVDIYAKNNLAIRLAAKNGYIDVVKYLHEKGADIHAENDYAIRRAAEYGRLEIVKYLHENGANIHAEYDYAIRWAAYYRYLDIVKYLHKNGANIQAINELPIRWVKSNDHSEFIKYLQENGVILN